MRRAQKRIVKVVAPTRRWLCCCFRSRVGADEATVDGTRAKRLGQIKSKELEENAPLSFIHVLLHFHGTVMDRIYPQLLLIIAVSVFCYVWDRNRGTMPLIDIPNTAHSIFGEAHAGRPVGE